MTENKQDVGAVWGNFGFPGAGAMTVPNAIPNAAPEVVTKVESIMDRAKIVGYIAAKKNVLVSAVDDAQGRKMFNEWKKNDVSVNPGKYIYSKKNSKGEVVSKITIDTKTNYTQGIMKEFLPEQFKTIQGKYKVALKEEKPEYFVVHIPDRKNAKLTLDNQNPQDERFIRDASIKSTDESVLLIKERALIQALFATESYELKAEKDGVVVGTLSPEITKRVKDGKPSFIFKATYYSPSKAKVKLGEFRLPYAVNYSYSQEPAGIKEVINQNQVNKFNPNLKIESLGLSTGHKGIKKVDQAIPYADYKTQYETMGVTEEMFEALRSPGSSSTFTVSDIIGKFKEGRALYNEYQSK